MSRTEQGGDQPPGPSCWFCQRPGATGVRRLGASPGRQGTAIPVCREGVGCRDGRIYHGPLAPPHHPGEQCAVCSARGPAPRGNQARRSTAAVNRSPRHR